MKITEVNYRINRLGNK